MSTAAPAEFHFREPAPAAYVAVEPGPLSRAGRTSETRLKLRPRHREIPIVESGRRLVLELSSGTELSSLIAGRPLELSRHITGRVFVLEAPDAWTAAAEAERLAVLPGVRSCCPVMRRPKQLAGLYARAPADPYFEHQWHLENRDTNGVPLGVDLNIRAAWPLTRGEGTVLAIVDDGIESEHPDLRDRAVAELHFNFLDGSTNARPATLGDNHGTAVAGIAIADGANGRGAIGVAPEARFASWKLFQGGTLPASDEQLMDMFQYRSNAVSVQNHSWSSPFYFQYAPSLLEHIAISNAVTQGRGGKGVVIVRAGGSLITDEGQDGNDDGYTSDPRVISVAAVRTDGRVMSRGRPGACLLVAAPGGDVTGDTPTIFTTDRQGTNGYNQINFFNQPDLNDYAFGAFGLTGTSAAAPQIAGLAALMLSVNPGLTVRDVQQILVLSARQFDPADPGLATNGAGLAVSHRVGFGVPDAGYAVELARGWSNRPPLLGVAHQQTQSVAIPDDGLRVVIAGTDVPADLVSIPATPSLGIHPDDPTGLLPLADAGLATSELTINLTNQLALIGRGSNTFSEKIEFAARAGAAAVIIYNHQGDSNRLVMASTEFGRIPAVFIGGTHGERLRDLARTNPGVRARLELNAATYRFEVSQTLLCEHVGIQIQTDHPARSDLRITMRSPHGTRSVLQRINSDTNSPLTDWTYYSTHHFYEGSAGSWTVSVADEAPGSTGSVRGLTLFIHGTALSDADHDGLDDAWELAHFQSLAGGPRDDPDADGFLNAREQVAGTDPAAADSPFRVDVAQWNRAVLRLSWPSDPYTNYDLIALVDPAAPGTPVDSVSGRFRELEWFIPHGDLPHRFFRVRPQPRPPVQREP